MPKFARNLNYMLTDAIVGRDSSIGIFLWDTNSFANRMIPAADAGPSIDLEIPSLADLLNRTGATGVKDGTHVS